MSAVISDRACRSTVPCELVFSTTMNGSESLLHAKSITSSRTARMLAGLTRAQGRVLVKMELPKIND